MAVTVKVGAIGGVPVEIGESEALDLGIGDKIYIKGDPGPRGEPGPQGEPGPRGETGDRGLQGEPGVSPVITVTELTHAHKVTITGAQGTQTFVVSDGEGVGIENAELNEDYTLTITYTDGTSYTTPPIRGEQGATGPAGTDGAPGSDGTTFTPSVSSAGVISWTNDGGKTNPDPVNIKGPQGNPGTPGRDGTDGEDGFSPSVSVTTITGGYRVSVTDASGTDTFDVMDGATGPTGPAGPGVPTGGSAGQILAKVNGTDYNTYWINPPAPSGFVSYAQTQSLTAAQRKRARGNIGANWVLLWQNASPTSEFAAQTISFNYSAYDFLAVVVRNRTDQPVQQTIIFKAQTGGGYASSKSTLVAYGMYFQYREGNLVSGGLSIGDGMEGSVDRGGTQYPATINAVLIPLEIYGITNL